MKLLAQVLNFSFQLFNHQLELSTYIGLVLKRSNGLFQIIDFHVQNVLLFIGILKTELTRLEIGLELVRKGLDILKFLLENGKLLCILLIGGVAGIKIFKLLNEIGDLSLEFDIELVYLCVQVGHLSSQTFVFLIEGVFLFIALTKSDFQFGNLARLLITIA